MIPDKIKDDILFRARIEEVAADLFELKKTGRVIYTVCPKCGADGKGKGLLITPSKQIYKCFQCDYGGNSSVNLLIENRNMNYPEALKYLASKYNIIIDEEPKARGPQKRADKPAIKTFCDRQLESSGLSIQDITATVYVDNETEKKVEVYEAGTRDQFGRVVDGDDMIIWYYDLEGKPVMYQKEKTQKFEHLYRIRWQVPENHPDKHGRPIKYQSPSGSGSHLYIPEVMRRLYKERRVIKRLFIQEGEKKADKASLHGLPSVGIMGIHNISINGHMPHEIQLIVQACQVEEVVFMIDADWDQLSTNLKPGDRVDQRTASFYNAVKNFREYFKAFANIGAYLECYFGHIKLNERKEKGIDDLLAGSLKGSEIDLRDDIEQAINNIKMKAGEGEFVQLHKVTPMTDIQIQQIWGFDSSKSFLKKYHDHLLDIFPNGEVFRYGRLEWRYNTDTKEFEPAQPITPDEQYWEEVVWEDMRGNEKKKLQFDYVNLKKFLKNRGFFRILMANGRYLFARNTGKIVQNIESGEIKDFVIDFTEEIAPKDVQNMILRGARMYLGSDTLGNIFKINPEFQKPDRGTHNLYFQSKFWAITNNEIIEKPLTSLTHYIWHDEIIDFDASRVIEPMVKVEKISADILNMVPRDKQNELKHFVGQYEVELTETGKQCHFLRFLLNSSEFTWRKLIDPKKYLPLSTDERTLDEKLETCMHLMSKLTSIGYMLHDYIDDSTAKMVIGMDGKLSEVGESNGRSGKSLLGFYIGQIVPQVYIPAKAKDLTEDKFLFEGVTEKTRNVFLDDTRANIDIEFFYPQITGLFTVRPLGEKKYVLPEGRKPKLYATTNHGVNDAGGS
ncbi:MAG: CHC2 zinc finger domain-containing protein, partial [Bacteroidales bacterium]